MAKHIVIFASGNGSNAQNIIQYFQQKTIGHVIYVLTNNEHAKVLARANTLNVSAKAFTKQELNNPYGVLETLKTLQPDLIVLSGFLLKFPAHIIAEYPKKVINIHPALLPKYGGKGMYGKYVHEAVVANQETESGITIHFVNEEYDEGAIIFQAKTALSNHDSPETVAAKVHQLEYEHFPKVIERILEDQ